MPIHKRFSKKHLWVILLIAALCIVASDAFAQPTFDPPTKSREFKDILKGIANFIGKLGIPVATFFLVLTGFMFVAAQGNAQKLEEARRMLWWVLVGTAIVVGAGPIATMIINFAEGL